MSQDNSLKKQIKVEYEGQIYSVDADKLEGLDEKQILDILSVGFPGMANGKLERLEEGNSLKITKRVGTKGRQELDKLIDILIQSPEDPLPAQLSDFNHELTEELTIADWERIYETLDFEKVRQTLNEREKLIQSTIIQLYQCPTNIVPLI